MAESTIHVTTTESEFPDAKLAEIDKAIQAVSELVEEHSDWSKAFGHALLRFMQDDYAPMRHLAESVSIVFPCGEPVVESKAIAAFKTGEVGDGRLNAYEIAQAGHRGGIDQAIDRAMGEK